MLPPSPRGTPLSPVAFLDRAAAVFPHRTGVVDGERRRTWAQLAERARRLAVALQAAGIGRGDPVAVLAPSSAELLEVHFGVAAAGAVLVAVDPRLPEGPVAELLERSRVRLLVVDAAPAALGTAAARRAGVAHVLVCGAGGSYDAFLDGACGGLPVTRPAHEEDLLSVTYGLGTADQPGAVATTHRAAYLDAVAEVHHARLDTRSVYLWAVPSPHACASFPWAVTAAAAKHVCLPAVDGPGVGRALADEGVTHLGAGPAGGALEEPAAPALWSRAARAGEAGPGFRIRRVPVTLDAEREPAIVPEPAGHAAAPGRADLAA